MPPPLEPTTPYDVYGAARLLVTALRREGFEETARLLDDTLAAGFTSSEILMGLRHHIDRFLAIASSCPVALGRDAQDLRDRIDRALG